MIETIKRVGSEEIIIDKKVADTLARYGAKIAKNGGYFVVRGGKVKEILGYDGFPLARFVFLVHHNKIQNNVEVRMNHPNINDFTLANIHLYNKKTGKYISEPKIKTNEVRATSKPILVKVEINISKLVVYLLESLTHIIKILLITLFLYIFSNLLLKIEPDTYRFIDEIPPTYIYFIVIAIYFIYGFRGNVYFSPKKQLMKKEYKKASILLLRNLLRNILLFAASSILIILIGAILSIKTQGN